MTPDENHLKRVDKITVVLIAALLVAVIVAAIAALVALKTASQNAKTLERIEQVRAASRDQTCTLFERQEAANVARIRNTYAYLEGLDLTDRGTSITKAVIRGLPQQEQEAKAARAPPYCNAPGVGLPEPEKGACKRLLPSCLELPRHRDFRELLKPAP